MTSISFVIYLSHLQVIRHFDGCKADLVVCDGAPDGKTIFRVSNLAYSLKHFGCFFFVPLSFLSLFYSLWIFSNWSS